MNKTLFSRKGQEILLTFFKSRIPAKETPLLKSLEFQVPGEKLANAIKTKIEALKAQREIYIALQEAAQSVATKSDVVAGAAPTPEAKPQVAVMDYSWRVRGCDNQIQRYERLLKYIEPKGKYKISEYDLESYGL